MPNPETISCRICGETTLANPTKLCERCFNMANAIAGDPELARKILADIDKERGND